MSAKAATGIGDSAFFEDFDHVVLSVDTADSASMTIKFQISMAEDEPDFTAAQSSTNRWAYVEVVNYEDSADVLDGDTGLVLTGTDVNRQYEVNVNGARWVNARITARAAGSATIKARGFKKDSGRT